MFVACGLPLLKLQVAITVIHWFNGTFVHFRTSWHAKRSLALNEPMWIVLCSNHHTNSEHAPKLTKHGKCCMQNNHLLTKTPAELQDNFITCVHFHIKCDIRADLLLCDETEGAVAGATAGVVVEAALYPIDTIKTRLQVSSFWHQFQYNVMIKFLSK